MPPITLWEQHAAMGKLRVDGANAPAQAKMFEAVLDQRLLIDQANAKTKGRDAAFSGATTLQTRLPAKSRLQGVLWTTRSP